MSGVLRAGLFVRAKGSGQVIAKRSGTNQPRRADLLRGLKGGCQSHAAASPRSCWNFQRFLARSTRLCILEVTIGGEPFIVYMPHGGYPNEEVDWMYERAGLRFCQRSAEGKLLWQFMATGMLKPLRGRVMMKIRVWAFMRPKGSTKEEYFFSRWATKGAYSLKTHRPTAWP